MPEFSGPPDGKAPLPAGYYLYSLLCFAAALLNVTGGWRAVVGFLHSLPIPEVLVGAIAGILQIVWVELAYLTARPLKSVELFDVLPAIGSALTFASAFVVLYWKRRGVKIVVSILLLEILLSLFAFAVSYNFGLLDKYRAVATLAYLCTVLCWYLYFRYSGLQPSREASTNRR